MYIFEWLLYDNEKEKSYVWLSVIVERERVPPPELLLPTPKN